MPLLNSPITSGPISSSPITLLLARELRTLGRRAAGDARLHRVRPGVYADAEAWALLLPWERYLARVHAVALTWHEPVFMLESAAALTGLPVFREPADIHLLAPGPHSYRRGDVVVHSSPDPRELLAAGGLTATGISDTAVDLARVLPPAHGLAVADAALRTLRTTREELGLLERGRAQRNTRGLATLEWVDEHATGDSESVGESVGRAVIGWLGHEAPELQVTFRLEGCIDRADFFWRRFGVIGESDGYGKYDAPTRDEARERLISEKKREDRLRRAVRGFARWDLADCYAFERLDHKLAVAGLDRVRPRQNAFLATLARDPRARASARDRPFGARQPGGR